MLFESQVKSPTLLKTFLHHSSEGTFLIFPCITDETHPSSGEEGRKVYSSNDILSYVLGKPPIPIRKAAHKSGKAIRTCDISKVPRAHRYSRYLKGFKKKGKPEAPSTVYITPIDEQK